MKTGMRKKLLASTLVSLFSLPLALSAQAQSGTSSAHPSATQPATSGSSAASTQSSKRAANAQKTALDMRASKLMGKEVKNAKGENLGEIKDLMVDMKSGQVPYAVLSFGGIAGLGDKLFAYPVSSFKPSANSDELVLNVDQERLKNAPGFDKDKWPDWTNNNYRSEIDRYHNSPSAKTASASSGLMRASKVLGKDVNDRQGKDAGEIEDLVVNLGNGKVHYAVLDFDKAWSPDDKLVALPLKAFTIPSDPDKDLVLNASRDTIKAAKAFDEKQWADLNKPDFKRSMDTSLARFKADTGGTASGSSGGTGSTQTGNK